jgi:hypothetical protein
MMGLPPAATDASRHRYEIASELAGTCPARMGREIALTGSVSRGIADDLYNLVLWRDACSMVTVAQWQSPGLWFRRLGVRVPSVTPTPFCAPFAIVMERDHARDRA